MIDNKSPETITTHIPRGVADYFWREAQDRRTSEAALLEIFHRWGYADVMPPTFEYADVLAARANSQLQAELVRFLDRDGSTLALRPDMTIAVARLVGTRLHDWPMPQRFCYAGSVFRYVEPQAGRQREFRQAGVELIGAGKPSADAEVLALTAAALRAAGLAEFRLVVGQMGFFSALLGELKLAPDAQQLLTRAIDTNSEPALADFLRDVPLRTQQRRTVEELPALSGADAATIIAQADRLCLNYAMHAAVANLRAIVDYLDHYSAVDTIYVDLTEINNLGYYTGITFEALAPGLGFAVASGGRYDHLVGTFGSPQPAVGVAFSIDRILLATRAQHPDAGHFGPPPPDAVVVTHDDPTALRLVSQWRSAGHRIVVDVSGNPPATVWPAAQQTGARLLLAWTGNAFDVYCATTADAPRPRWDGAEATRRLGDAT